MASSRAGDPAAARFALRRDTGPDAPLRRLKLIGIVLPVLFIVAVELLRMAVIDHWWPDHGHLFLGLLSVPAVVAFGITLFFFIDRVHRMVLRQNRELAAVVSQQVDSAVQRSRLIADLQRRRREDQAIYRLLLTISSQDSPTATLASVIDTARDLLGADLAGMCLNRTTAGLVSIDVTSTGEPVPGRPVCITGDGARACDDCATGCPVRTRKRYPALVSAPLRGPWGTLGKIWLARRSAVPFSDRDESFLITLSELAVVALNHARMLEHERQGAILAERERIARELHDSLAQVLGVVQLRLRVVTGWPELSGAAGAQGELTELIGMCQDAYHDVREAILGLRESSRADRALLESLRAYVEKLSRQSRIEITLATTLDHEPALTPQCEVQVIRVIQEALTNVRKHSGARSAVVRISETPESTTFMVEDDGRGFDPGGVPADREGFGLHSMRERIKLINGELTIDAEPGRGTRVVVEVPASHRVPVSESAAAEDWSALLRPRRLRPVYGTPQPRPRFPRMKAYGS